MPDVGVGLTAAAAQAKTLEWDRNAEPDMLVMAVSVPALVGVSEAATVHLLVNPNTETDWAGDRLYRAPGACATPGPFVLVQTVPPTTGGALVEFTDATAPDGTVCYRATAFDQAGNESAPSNTVQVTVDGTPPAVPTHLRMASSGEEPKGH